MRLIGHLANESSARTFSEYLYAEGMENKLEFQPEEGWGVWVNDEDKLEESTRLLDQFRANPQAPEYQAKAQQAVGLRAEKQKNEEQWRKRLYERRHLFRPLRGYGLGPLTLVLILISVGVFIFSGLHADWQRLSALAIANLSVEGNMVQWYPGLQEIRHGELWRLVTPIFIHMNIPHIFFNLWWLRDLGSMIEGRQSSWHLLVLVLFTAAGSNLGEYLVIHSPLFGGMSGVVYALLGYIWLRGKFDPASGLFLHPSTVTMMMIWLVVCYTGIVGPIANTAHLVGLAMGSAWGYLSSLRYR
jgi:rhomboid protease GlpG